MPHERRLGCLTWKMLGGECEHAAHPGRAIKLKAAETATMLEFAIDRLTVYKENVAHHAPLLNAGEAMLKWIKTCRTARTRLTPQEYQILLDNCNRFLCSCDAAGIASTPKFHLFGHLTARRGGEIRNGPQECQGGRGATDLNEGG